MTKYYPAGSTYYKNKKISVNKIEVSDIWVSLKLGWRDFMHQPSHYFFAIILYPFIGIILWLWASKENTIQLIFPMMSGFALFGPFIAIFLYEISRRLESGLDTSWSQIFRLVYSPALRQVIILSIMLLFIFFTWMICAYILFQLLYGSSYPISMFNFLVNIITTPRGWLLIILGNGMGACFALTALHTTVVAFPILIDTEVSAIKAIQISMLAVRINPIPLIFWGFLVSFRPSNGSAVCHDWLNYSTSSVRACDLASLPQDSKRFLLSFSCIKNIFYFPFLDISFIILRGH